MTHLETESASYRRGFAVAILSPAAHYPVRCSMSRVERFSAVLMQISATAPSRVSYVMLLPYCSVGGTRHYLWLLSGVQEIQTGGTITSATLGR